jgi:hypothetical protein
MRRVTVQYTLGPYEGSTVIVADDDEENETIFARARRKITVTSPSTLPMAASFFRILHDEPTEPL